MFKSSSNQSFSKWTAASLAFGLALASFALGWTVADVDPQVSRTRGPASAEEDETDAYDSQLYANDSIQDLEREYRRLNAKTRRANRHLQSPRSPSALAAEIFKNVLDPQTNDALKMKIEAETRTGIHARRARLVVIRTDLFREAAMQGRMLLPLFDNAILTFSLQAPSAFGVNHSIYVGQISDEPSSRVRITVNGTLMSGRIETSKGIYQIVSAGGGGRHYIIEVDPLPSQK